MRLFHEVLKQGAEWLTAEVILADNVLTAVDESPDNQFWKDAGDFIIAPPFETMLIEGRSAKTGISYLTQLEILEPERARSFIKSQRPGSIKIPDIAKWVYAIRCFVDKGKGMQSIPGSTFVSVDEHGKSLSRESFDTIILPIDVPYLRQMQMSREDISVITGNIVSFTFYVISLMNCKNVEKVETWFPRAEQRRLKKAIGGQPKNSYYILQVKRSKRQQAAIDTQLGEKLDEAQRRQHIVRGHFKVYTEESPLFGKYIGMWYWEPALRGNAALGVIDKDYEVDMPDEDMSHAG